MSTKHLSHVLGYMLEHPWAIEPSMLPILAGIVAKHAAGLEMSAEIEAALVNRKNLPQARAGSALIIPIYGVIAPRMNLMSEMSGGTTFETLGKQLQQAVADPEIKSIVFDVNSPGGSVAGATEFARDVIAARKTKPIIAVAQYTMASAAYWAMAGATEVIAAPSARIGAIGVYTSHDDVSEAMAKLGVKRTYIAAGTGKVDGNPAEPLTEEAHARIKASVDEAYGQFVADVVKGRGGDLTAEHVRGKWQAHVYGASQAKALGLIDSVGTLEGVIARLSAGSTHVPTARASQADHDLERAVFEMQLTN